MALQCNSYRYGGFLECYFKLQFSAFWSIYGKKSPPLPKKLNPSRKNLNPSRKNLNPPEKISTPLEKISTPPEKSQPLPKNINSKPPLP